MIGLNSLTRGAVLGAMLLALPGWAQAAAAGATGSPPDAASAREVPSTPPAAPDAPAPAPAAAAAAGSALHLSRRQAVEEALSHNAGIVAAAQQVEEARAQAVTAAAFADPTLSADTMGETHPLDVGTGNITDLYVGFTVPFPGKRRLRREVAAANVSAAEFTLDQTRHQVASQAAQDYDALLVALRHRQDLEQSKQFSAEFLAKTQARYLGGTAPKVDVVKAKVDLAQAENDLIANERTIDAARAALNRICGRLGGAPVEAAEPLAVPAALPGVDSLERLAEASRPELRSLAAQRQGARSATRLAREFWAPDFNLTLARNAFDAGPTTYTTTLLIGVPVFFWQHEKGEVANARHRELELAATSSDELAQVSLDVRNAYATAATALRQVVFIRDELLPEAQEVYRVAAYSYGLGATSALDFLDAKRTLVDAQRQYVDALGSANDAQAALELAVGAPLPPASPGGQP
ncbi:MAG TPA: TolC family protein [Thermoanaerobaculia bacterium]